MGLYNLTVILKDSFDLRKPKKLSILGKIYFYEVIFCKGLTPFILFYFAVFLSGLV